MQSKTFKEAVCARYRCSSERYPGKVFWHCLYRHAIPVALVLRYLYPRFFREDFNLARELEQARSISDVRVEIDNYSAANRMHGHTVRNQLLLRISGRKVMKFASNLFGETNPRQDEQRADPA